MGKNYYNNYRFKKAHNIMDYNPEESLRLISDYLMEYPNDYSAHLDHINLLISLGHVNKAKAAIKAIELQVSEDEEYKRLSSKYQYFKRKLIFMKAKLLAFKEKYTELYDFCLNYYDELNAVDSLQLYYMMLYCKKRIEEKKSKKAFPKKNDQDEFVETPYEQGNYMNRQIIDYSESEFMENQNRFLYAYGNLEKTGGRIFSEDFPFEDLLDVIKKSINDDNNSKFFVSPITDSYIFRYDECGFDKGHLVDHFKVECFHNTDEIIVMYPVYGYGDRKCIDLNYLREPSPRIIRKERKSQVEKFYSRYNK